MAAVNALTGRPPLNVAALETAVGDPRRLFLVATGDEGMVGWAKTHCWDRPDGAAPAGHYLGGVVVAPAARRRGLATALTQARMDWIWEHCREAFYVVNASNLPSIELHRRWGFSEVARASAFHTTSFTGGVGLLMRAVLPEP